MIPGGIAIVNEVSEIPNDMIATMTQAVAKQIVLDVAPDWSRLPCYPTFYADKSTVPAGMATIAVVLDADQADALGYHTEERDGRLTGIVAWNPVKAAGGLILTGDWSLSSVLSHEVIEMGLDPFCNAMARDSEGNKWMQEPGDMVEGRGYQIDGVTVANYVRPHFFDTMAPPGASFDKVGILSRAFTLTDLGYAMIETPDGATQQLGERPPYKPASKYSRHFQAEPRIVSADKWRVK